MKREIKWLDPMLEVKDIGDLIAEDIHQLKKWGVQTVSPFEWMAYLTEEVGELAAAITENYYYKGTQEQIKKEAIQVATLALKIAKMSQQ